MKEYAEKVTAKAKVAKDARIAAEVEAERRRRPTEDKRQTFVYLCVLSNHF